MKAGIYLVALLIFMPLLVKSQNTALQNKLPTADEIIEKYIQAVGGREANFKLKTARIFGTVEVTPVNVTGTFDVYAKAPNKFLTAMNVTQLGELKEGFNGQTAWIRTDQIGVQVFNVAKQAEIVRNADFYKYFNFKKHFSKAKVSVVDKDVDKPAYLIELTPTAGGSLEKMYFDQLSGLLIRRDVMRIGFQGKSLPATIYYGDYREIDGVKIPFYLKQISGKMIFEQKIVGVKNNVAINDEIFDPPLK